MSGVISRGVRAPIIREGDDIVKLTADAVEAAMKSEGFELHERDIVAVTESVVARSDGNYASVDAIATDHAPHSAEEKSRGLEKSAFGIVGIETAFPILYTCLVKPGILSLNKLLELLCVNPRRRFGLPLGTDYSIWDLNAAYAIDPKDFLSKGRATPFAGWQVNGKCIATICDGKLVYAAPETHTAK